MLGKRKFRTSQARRREQRRILIRTALLSTMVVVVCAGLVYTLQWDNLRIQQVTIVTDGTLAETELVTHLQTNLTGSRVWFIPRNSSLFLGIQTLEENMQIAFPRIASVAMQRAGVTTLSASITERTPSALWCGDVVPPIAYQDSIESQDTAEEAWGTCYMIDETGYLYARAPLFTGSMFPRYYGSVPGTQPVGQSFLPQEKFIHWQEFFITLKDAGLTPKALLFVDERDIEIYLGNGLRVIAPRTDDLGRITRRLVATLDSETIDFTRPVEYLDLRFGSKAFVRYREEATKE